ncbi:TPA: hypothetical protein ACPJ1O_002817 [Vibrio diabolicus]
MKVLRGEALYWSAFERLKSGKAKIVDTLSPRFKFTKDNVAIEAGKSKGFVKQDRYPELCRAINEAEHNRIKELGSYNQKKDALKCAKIQKNKANARYAKLKNEYELCLEKMMNLLRENHELRKEIESLKR